jgi:hypothetical protein
MVLESGPASKICEQLIGILDLSPAAQGLKRTLNSYIVACVGEKSTLTVENYRRRLEAFVAFFESPD